MGRVFLGESPSGRLVAVKLIRPELADDAGFRRRFAQEVTAARRVSGIFTAPVVDADPDGPQPWLVTAYVAGPSLTDAVDAQGPMPVESLLTLAAGLAEGLRAVHAAGVVHRDLKPSNVLLARDGPRIIDFGISRAADSAWLTNAGGVIGSPGFMSPEQAEGRPVGTPADVFSLGGVLAFAATGEAPFGSGAPSALLYRVVYGTAATGRVPAEFRGLVERCLAKNPASRPTAGELLAELGEAGPATGWLSWQSAACAAGDLPVTQLDDLLDIPGAEPGTRVDPAGNVAVAGRGRAPRRSVPSRRRGHAIVVGLTVAAVLAVGAAAAVAYAVLSQHQVSNRDSGQAGDGGSPRPAQVVTRSGRSGSAIAARGGTSQPPGPRAVVDSYFAAINDRDWPEVWRLGGANLSPSYPDMVAGYADTARDVIRSIRIVGDHVLVRVRAYETDGTLQVYEMDFLVEDGVISGGSRLLLDASTLALGPGTGIP